MDLSAINSIAFIGAGNMAQAMIRGLLASGLHPNKIVATTRRLESAQKVQQAFGIRIANSNKEACQQADVIVLAVKPQKLQDVCSELRDSLTPGCFILSVAAGIRIESLERWLGEHAIVRCMPNTPASIGLGASALYCNQAVTEPQRELAQSILAAVGLSLIVEKESLLDAVTAISGSGPAYFFLFTEAMVAAGKKLGLDAHTAEQLALQTAVGASQLALQNETSLSALRHQVTSPNGTTERALLTFQSGGLGALVEQAMQACAHRAQELSDELGNP